MTLPQSHFRDLYDRSPDPWRISVGWYERRKRALALAALPRERFRRVFEPGCGNGELTAQLALRADEVIAWDGVERAVLTCRARLGAAPAAGRVDVRAATVPDEWPDGEFDLVVLSELGYYLDADDLDAVLRRTVAGLEPDGVLLAVHWRHPAPGYPRTGDEVHAAIADVAGLHPLASYRDEDFALDVLVRGPAAPQSVARAQGVIA